MRPNASSRFLAAIVALALACTAGDDAPADTDAATDTSTASPTSTADDAPLLDSTGDGPTTAGSDTATDGGTTMGTTDDTASTDDGPMGCAGDDECTDADAPFCVNMLCSPCSATDDPDASCAEKFPDTPACVASECVECGDDSHCTEATAPLCDTTTQTCIPCTAHDQCPGDAACELLTGACFPADEVYYVDSAAACPGMGTMASPWCLLQTHITEIPAGGARTFHLAAGRRTRRTSSSTATDASRSSAISKSPRSSARRS